MRAITPSKGWSTARHDASRGRTALDLLREQHGQVHALFEQLDDAAVEYRQALVEELASVLVAYVALERELLYPTIARTSEVRVLAAREELAMIEACVAKLLQIKTSDRTFHAKLSVLEDIVRRHVEMAEGEIFALVERAVGEGLADLRGRMAERFAELRALDPRVLLAQSVAESSPSSFRLLGTPDSEILHADPASAVPAGHEPARAPSPRSAARRMSRLSGRRAGAGPLR